MDRFEYAVGLFSIVVGLGLADIGVSIHRLLKHRAQVRWTPLALATAAYVILLLVTQWYELWFLRDFKGVTSFWFFLGLLAQLFLLFLLAAAVLPDEGEEGYDLHAYYARQQRYIWTLLLLFQLSFAALWTYFFIPLNQPLLPRLHQVAVPLGGALILLLVRRPRVQLATVLLLFLFKAKDYGADAFY